MRQKTAVFLELFPNGCLSFLRLGLFIALFLPTFLFAQISYASNHAMQEALQQARQYMIAYQGDKALPITQSLLAQLEDQAQYDSHFGFQVRLIHGLSLVRSTQEASSFEYLWRLRDDSKAMGEWAVFAESCRGIAFVLELAEQPEEALYNLRQALGVIKKYQLDSVYAPMAIRHSSVHRQYGSLDSARYFAEEALRIAPEHGQLLEEASGNFLMSIYTSDHEAKLAYLKRATKLYFQVGELKIFISMHNNLAKQYLKTRASEKALLHTDTAINHHHLIPKKEFRDAHRSFEYRASAFEQLGVLDSAIHYYKKAHAIELEETEKIQRSLLAELDKKYNLERKTEELRAEQEKNWLLGAIASLFILLSIGLIYYSVKLRKANQVTEQQAEELKALDQTKSRFFANVSHELRTPLALMLGPIQLLLQNFSPNIKEKELLQMAKRSGKRLEQLINEILDLRKLQSHKMTIKRSPTQLTPFYRLHIGQFSSLALSKDIQYTWHIDVEEEVVVNLDQEKSRQVLYNLLSNAFKYTPPGGQIDVAVQLKGNEVHLTVKDTGIGIHPDDLPHLFDPYFQTRRPEKPVEGGTGIGLAICKEYLQLLGGAIDVQSALGKGTRFSCWFPVEKVSEEEAESLSASDVELAPLSPIQNLAEKSPAKQEVASDTMAKRPHLLVVEDNPDLRAFVHMILAKKYQLTLVENGKQALAALSDANRFQLILSDIMMPEMDGFQLLETLKSNERTRHIPVLMLTARADTTDKLQALRIGVDDYMAKPFEEEELLVRIENLLNNYAIRIAFTREEQTDQGALPIMSAPDRAWLTNFEAFVRAHLDLTSLSISLLAHEFAMSESTLLRQLKRLTGLSPQQYIIEVRMAEARHLIEERKLASIKQIAAAVGYNDTRAFSRTFKKRIGKAPSELLPA